MFIALTKKPSHTSTNAENATLNKKLEIYPAQTKMFFGKGTLFSCWRVKSMYCADMVKFNSLRIDPFRC